MCMVPGHSTLADLQPWTLAMVTKDTGNARCVSDRLSLRVASYAGRSVCVRRAPFMCMACMIPLISAAGMCVFGHLQHALSSSPNFGDETRYVGGEPRAGCSCTSGWNRWSKVNALVGKVHVPRSQGTSCTSRFVVHASLIQIPVVSRHALVAHPFLIRIQWSVPCLQIIAILDFGSSLWYSLG